MRAKGKNENLRLKSQVVSFALSICLLTFAFCLLTSPPPAAAAQDNGGANAGLTLRFSPSARWAGMGDAANAAATGVAAVHYNPAGLGWTDRREIGLMYQNLVLDVGQGSLGYAHPLSGGASAWGVLVQYVSFGSTQRTVVSGTAGVASGTFSGQDIAVSLGYGARLGNWGYGAAVKLYNSEIDNAGARAVAADLGIRWRGENSPFSLGASVSNLGTEVKYDYASERLPIVFRAGGAWEVLTNRLLVTADVEKVTKENWSGHAGVEFRPVEMLSLRAGYDGSIEIDNGLTVGAGFRTGGLELDYAWIPFGVAGDNHRIGINYKF